MVALAAPVAPATAREAMSFEAAMRRYIQAHHVTWSNAKHARQWETSLRNHAAPLMRQNVAQITSADIEAVMLPIWLSKIETASRVRQRIERVLSASIARGDRPGPNPAAWRDNLEHILPAQSKVRKVKHHAAVPWEDAPAAFRTIWDMRGTGTGYQALVTLILTGMRSGEVRSLEWEDIKRDHLLIPAERMKARKAQRFGMSLPLAIWLDSLPRIEGTDCVHPGRFNRLMSDETIATAMQGAGLGEYTVHGWRSTFSDWANAQGWSRDLIEDALAHQIGNSTERAYRRGDYLDRRQKLMAAWARYLLS
ncbi:tyrosine-type recombinase/integrase [Tateyamaria sp.]|uniref:tyrosine-type recombinase/integrase n=1 Tax=Tateyamaria sp. TaxID=1929288 RepID=UPI00329A91FD